MQFLSQNVGWSGEWGTGRDQFVHSAVSSHVLLYCMHFGKFALRSMETDFVCVCVLEASTEDLRTIAIFKGRCGEISGKAISLIFYSLAPNRHLNSYIHSFNNHSFEPGVQI